MTLLLFDGFEAGDANTRYNGSGMTTTSATRFSSGLAVNTTSLIASFTPSAEIYVGVAVQVPSSLDGNLRAIFYFKGDGGSTFHTLVAMRAGAIEVRLGSSAAAPLIASGGGGYVSGAWYYLEMYVKIADSGGQVAVKVDGTQVINFTGDTRNGGTDTDIDQIQFQGNGVSCYLDDYSVYNALGSVNNTWPGDRRVITLSPTGAGNSTQMTPSTGSNWQTVDELPVSSTDYVDGDIGEKDTYALANLPSNVTAVHAVQAAVVAKKTDAGDMSMRPILRSGSTDYAGTTTTVGAADAVKFDMWETDPATSAAWLVAAVNAAEVGVEAL